MPPTRAGVHVVASILEFVSNPLVGAVSDDRGRKNFLLMSLLATAVSLLAIGVAPSKFTIAVSGALRGLTAVSITMGNAMIVDMSKLGQRDGGRRARMATGQRGDQQQPAVPISDRSTAGSSDRQASGSISSEQSTGAGAVARDASGGDGEAERQDVTVNLGLLLAAAALGLMCGPIIGGVLSLVSLRAPFILAAVVEGVNMVFVRGLVPETLQRRTFFTWSAANPLRLAHMLFKTPVLRSGTLILILVNVGLAVYSQVRAWVPVGVSRTAPLRVTDAIVRAVRTLLFTTTFHHTGGAVDAASVRLEGPGPRLLPHLHRPPRWHHHRRCQQGPGAQVGRLPGPHRSAGVRRGTAAAAGPVDAQLDVVPGAPVHVAHVRGAHGAAGHHHQAGAPPHAGQDPGCVCARRYQGVGVVPCVHHCGGVRLADVKG